MPEAPIPEILLRNGLFEIGIDREGGGVSQWTERATGESLLRAPMGLNGLDLDPGGFLATVEEDEEGHEARLYGFGQGGKVGVQIVYRLAPEAGTLAVEIAVGVRTVAPASVELAWSGGAAEFTPGLPRRLELGGRQQAVFLGRVAPGRSLAGEIGWDAETIRIRVAEAVVGGKLFLKTAESTVEAPVSVYPERALEISLNGLAPVEAMIRGADGREILRAPVTSGPQPPVVGATPSSPAIDWAGLSDAELDGYGLSVPTRHLAAIERARRAGEAGELAEADGHLDDALLYNADDPLLWWQKAALQRHLEPERDRGEWLNARFLRPLEPRVAAEALLAQEGQPEEGNPLLTLVAGREAYAAECVAGYVEAGLAGDAVDLGHRILLYRDWQRVRVLLAWLYLSRTRMDVQASENWTARARAIGESEPSLAIEREALAGLTARFGA